MTTFTKTYNEMTAEREFAGFVLPFAAGIFLATGPALIRLTYFPLLGTASLTAVASLLIFMMHPYRQRTAVWFPWILTGVTGLAAGAFTGLTSLSIELSSYSIFGSWAEGYGRSLGNFIDGIPFGDSRTNALLKALVTGERNDIPKSISDAFRDSGAAHILSLSGFHLGIVYGIVRWSLSGLGNSPGATRLRSSLIILLCGLYTLATGAGPSIVRSFLFILLGEAALMFHRRRSTATLLFSSLLLQLFFSPSSIRSVSFQLSYAAMAGIAWIYPWLRDLWAGSPSDDRAFTRAVRRIWNSAAMSIACQLTTGPIAWFYFNSFPQHFLLTNLIALPLTSLLIPLGITAIILSSLGICPAILLRAADMLAQALSAALEIIAGM